MFKRTDIKPFEKHIYLATPTMHGEELKYVTEAYETNWMSTVGKNIDEVEKIALMAIILANLFNLIRLQRKRKEKQNSEGEKEFEKDHHE